MAVTRVVLADDRDLMLIGAKTVLSQYERYDVVGVCQTLPELETIITQTAPDVIVLGDHLEPDLDALALVNRIRAKAPQTRLIVMSRAAEGFILHDLLSLGVMGYLYKNDPLQNDLVEAVRAVAHNRLFLSPTASAEFLLAMKGDRSSMLRDDEARSVLRLLGQGNRPQEIALRCGISVRRVYRVMERLRYHFGSETNEQLMVQATASGLLA